MNREPSSFDQVYDLFVRASEVSDGERDELLERACADEPALRDEVEALLRIDAIAESRLPLEGRLELPRLEGRERFEAPESIDGYRLIEQIAAGGMGVVYRAEQEQPARQVALKILPTSDPRLYYRFLFETAVLARLHHPGIVPIYDSGFSKGPHARLPYFVMELVDGVSIDRYFAEQQPGFRQVAELLVRICDAVQHAHDHGILHRDLKPSNILVDGIGRPHILDFGIAKALGGDVAPSPEKTRTGVILGSLIVMSPEQAAADGRPIDVRSDVFSLGVLLYLGLTGRFPFAAEGKSLPEVLRLLIETTPPRPRALRKDLPRDLESIVLKALEPSPDRRYRSARDLADDLRRFIGGRPVLARRPTVTYRLTKLIRRHRVASIGIALAFLAGAMTASLMVRSWRLLTARSAQVDLIQFVLSGRADSKEELAREVERFREDADDDPLQLASAGGSFLSLAEIDLNRGARRSSRHVLEQAERFFADLRQLDPEEPSWTRQMATALIKQGDLDRHAGNLEDALALFLRAFELQEEWLRRFGPHDGLLDDLSWSHFRIGEAQRSLGDRAACQQHFEARLEICRELCRRPSVSSIHVHGLADSYRELGLMLKNAPELRDQYLEKSYRLAEQLIDKASREVALPALIRIASALARVRGEEGRFDEAARYSKQALAAAQDLLEGHESPTLEYRALSIQATECAARLARTLDRPRDAEAHFLDAIDQNEQYLAFAPTNLHHRKKSIQLAWELAELIYPDDPAGGEIWYHRSLNSAEFLARRPEATEAQKLDWIRRLHRAPGWLREPEAALRQTAEVITESSPPGDRIYLAQALYEAGQSDAADRLLVEMDESGVIDDKLRPRFEELRRRFSR